MIKRLVLLVIIFILSLSTPALAAEPGSGIIEGQVVNATEGAGSVADHDITLKTYLDNAEVDSITTKTDAEGRFVFDGLSTESGYSYQLTLNFQQADYYSEWLGFAEGETTKSTEVIVYDSTTSDEAIRVATAHTIIYIEQGSLRVEEYFLFVNESDRTYIGSREIAAGTNETLRFSLPEEATELQPAYGLMECCIYDSEDGFIDTMPVLPGNREVVFSYKVGYDSGAYLYSRKFNYPTTTFNLFVQGEGTEVTSDQLVPEGPLDIEGSRFNHVAGADLVQGDIVVAQLSGLPEDNIQGTVIWVALTLVVLTGGVGLGYRLRKKKVQPVSLEGNLEQRKQKLFVELAQMDDDFEAGKTSEEVYRRVRAEKKAHLLELMKEAEGERGNR